MWAEIVSKSINYDFYHTQSYHLLELKKKPILFVAFIDQDFIAIPILIRKIENTSYVDCTSVYGYSGPISNIDFEKLSKEHITYFQTQLLSYFKKSGFVSAFSRLNPIYSNGTVFKNFGDLINVNQTVFIDTIVSEELQKKRYRKSVAYDIKQLRKSNITIFEATEERPYALASLTLGDSNVPQAFSCNNKKLAEGGSDLQEFQCEGMNANLSIYISQKGDKLSANIYSEKLEIEVGNLNCSKDK